MLKRILLATAGIGLAAGAAVAALGPHDRTSLGSVSGGACAYCHNNTAAAALRGFQGAPAVTASGWGLRPIAVLCYKCHQGQLGGANVTDAVYDNFAALPATHGYAIAGGKAILATDGTLDPGVAGSNLPYTQGAELDCTSCHNVHEDTRTPFNVKTNIEEMCVACHTQRRSSAHNNSGSNAAARATHPVDIAIADQAATGAGNTAGTVLNTPAAILQGAEWRSGTQWVLGPKTVNVAGTEQMGCPTCHVVHNTTKFEDYLAINNNAASGGDAGQNSGAGAYSDLCLWCHSTTTGTYTQVIGAASDHPIDRRWLSINGGATGANIFYPRVVMLPGAWAGAGNADSDTGASEFINNGPTGYAANGLDSNGSAADNYGPHCSSCHDMHGAQDATSLYQGPSAGREGGFCSECHDMGDLAPRKHHSTVNTDEPAGTPAFTSRVECGHCHGTGDGPWKAHNGFQDFFGPITDTKTVGAQGGNWYQALCVQCHPVENPTNIQSFGVTPAVVIGQVTLPSSHGNPSGALSHVANEVADDDSSYNAAVPASFTANDLGGTSRSFVPKLGPSSVIGCESCHNLLQNVGDPANNTSGWKANLLIGALYEDDNALDGKTAEGVATEETLRSGTSFSNPARANRNHDGARTGDAFCRMCHNDGAATGYVHAPAAHTNLTVANGTFTYPVPLPYPHVAAETGILLSGNTVADACVAPGARAAAPWNVAGQSTACGAGGRPAVAPNSVFVYSAANRMDCDSCHRPHNADNLSSGPGVSGNINAILEVNAMTSGTAGDANLNTATANATKTEPCLLCHDPYWQP